MTRFVHAVARRLAGRNGLTAERPPPPTTPEIQQEKAGRDLRSIHDAHRAVDSFTAAMESAMRGQRRHGQARG